MEMTDKLYWVVGLIVIMNLGTIVAVMFALFKGVWWVAKLDGRVTDAKDTGVRAHKRVDRVEDLLLDLAKDRQ